MTPHPFPPEPSRRVLFLLLPEVNLLDLAGPAQVFAAAASLGANYSLAFCAHQPELVSAQGLAFARLEPLPPAGPRDRVLIPGMDLARYATGELRLEPAVREWLRGAYAAGAQLVSVCTGAFVLGEAGLLDHRRCTTHWSAIEALRARYPLARVQDAVLFTHDGPVTTSAGIAAGIDMALSVVEQEHGPLFAAQVARLLVVYLRRNGTHAQTSVFLQYRTHLHPGVHRAQDFLLEKLAEPVSLEQVAAAARMSVRSLSRAFREATGLTLTAYRQRLRLELARTLLHNPELSIEDVAVKTGFADVRHFRRLWSREFGFAPSAARQRGRA
ncbi:HTH-type transcriptional regulator CdhR [Calidithermus terrae]|uniref:HTH-type transcriptional regulator CdhR n=1 Tax=Calidithermus terrae TaxID=1408545 RepID=A0A399EHU3_9DEIN|nr:helix-turn-helix domain-containing protein [Calidithermus terrae]RIH83675.1 HTH-type transcriptional regulator CdhR [Calidithermus terrae]